MDKVSIITPIFNSIDTIKETYLSILSQSYNNWEWLVTDDCSTDGSYELLFDLTKEDKRIKLFRNASNQGAGYSRNNSIKHAKGRFIAFLDSDDLWLPTKLEKQISFMLSNNHALTYTQYQKFDRNGDKGIVLPPGSTSYDELLISNVIGCLTAVYDSSILGKRYMPLIRKRQDMGLWLDILKDIPKAYCLKEVLAKYSVDTGMTSNKLKVLSYQWKFYRTVVGLGFFKSCSVFILYAARGFIKHRI